jgi:hypothetical protein
MPFENCSGKARVFMVGIALGVLVAVSGLLLVIKKSDQVILEKDISHTLGLADENTPAVALRPWNKGEIAERIGLESVEKLDKETLALSERISSGFLPQNWESTCLETYSKAFCEVVADYFKNYDEIFSVSGNRSKRGFPLFDVKYLAALEAQEFSNLLSRLPDWDKTKMRRFSEAALKSEGCPKNFSLALSRKWEIHLDKEEFKNRNEGSIWGTMRKLEGAGLACLSLEDTGAEFAYFRAGVWDFLEGNFELSAQKFEKSLLSKVRKEEYRVRYWYMRALQSLGRQSEVQMQSKLLKEKYPISFHTLVTKTAEGEDPFTIFQSAPFYSDRNRSDSALVNLRLFWLLSLLENEQTSFAVKRYGEYFIKTMGTSGFDPALIQFLARNFDRMGYHRLQIMALNQIVVQRPTQVNLETLRLLFPRPFLEQLEKLTPQIDLGIILGLARQESGFDPGATSGVNARGLLQVLPSTAKGVSRRIDAKELYDYEKNIAVGGKYLMRLVSLFGGSVEKSLAAYNAGQGTLKKWEQRYSFIEDPVLFVDSMPYRETRDYVPSILRNAYWYHRLFPELTETVEARGAVTSEILKELIERSRSLKQGQGP